MTVRRGSTVHDCYTNLFIFVSSRNLLFVLVVSLACTAGLGFLGHQVVMVVMAGTEPKVTRAARDRLDPRDLQELLVAMERMAPKENLALPAKMEPLVKSLLETGKSAYGIT